MARTETYPWSTLAEVGDYFIVTDDFGKPHAYLTALVAQRNYHKKGLVKYATAKTTYGTLVMLIQVGEDLAPYDYEAAPGIFACSKNIDGNTEPKLGNKPAHRPVEQRDIVARMSAEVKKANLPWWHDPRTGQLIWNSQIATSEDTEKWLAKTFSPSADWPYPEYYNLDDNMMRRDDVLETDETEDIDWGDQTFEPGNNEEQ